MKTFIISLFLILNSGFAFAICGDANLDDQITVEDFYAMRGYVQNTNTRNPGFYDYSIYDLNGNGIINVWDYKAMQRGRDLKCPVVKSIYFEAQKPVEIIEIKQRVSKKLSVIPECRIHPQWTVGAFNRTNEELTIVALSLSPVKPRDGRILVADCYYGYKEEFNPINVVLATSIPW